MFEVLYHQFTLRETHLLAQNELYVKFYYLFIYKTHFRSYVSLDLLVLIVQRKAKNLKAESSKGRKAHKAENSLGRKYGQKIDAGGNFL